MNLRNLVGRGAAVAALMGLIAAPAARADGTMVPGGTIGTALYKSSANNIFATFIQSQASYNDDLYFYLTVPGAGQFIFSNHGTVAGTTVNVTQSSLLAIGNEAIFSICAQVAAVGTATTPGGACTASTQYYTGSASRNPDNQFHAAVWTRAAYLAGCATATAIATNACTAAGQAYLNTADGMQIEFIVGFEDSFNYNIDRDFNDIIFGLRGVSTVPEPVTMSLLATGLVGMGGVGSLRRRKIKK